MDTGHNSALTAKHAGLDAQIHAERTRPSPDGVLLARLKKEKLRIKESLTGH